MTGSRRTFVVVLQPPPDGVLVEDVRGRRRIRLSDVSQLAGQLLAWSADDAPATESEEQR